jgi:UDP-N-acetyl-D-galactosamine dehydrogenase|tara:strand:- start:8855 stop:10084 length:1230 start_codon:yes stop_codon:yes gene_type:complete
MKINPCVIGLGYVGLPVLINLSKKFNTCGFDINKKRILDLKKNLDTTKEFKKEELNTLKKTNLTFELNDIKKYNFFIICVPTPINTNKKPNLSPLISACKAIAKVIKKNDIIIFESTVYPGTTNDICVPIIEKFSKLKISKNDFFVCYSPERVNPGDSNHTLNKINKIIAIPNLKIKPIVKRVYKNLSKKLIINRNIEEAETSKVIENIQRDINIGLMNEVYIFCEKMNIDFNNVFKLASTKWNFGKYSPGLVGGHCLPVDPYYFSYIANKNKIQTRVTLAGRSINEYMRKFLIKKIKTTLKKDNFNYRSDRIIFAGLTYKKNVSDIRNSQSFKIFDYFKKTNKKILAIDPFVDQYSQKEIVNIDFISKIKEKACIIILVDHDNFSNISKKINKNTKVINIMDFHTYNS